MHVTTEITYRLDHAPVHVDDAVNRVLDEVCRWDIHNQIDESIITYRSPYVTELKLKGRFHLWYCSNRYHLGQGFFFDMALVHPLHD